MPTFRSSISAPLLFSAFAIADSNNLSINLAPFFGVNLRTSSAPDTFILRIISATNLPFCADKGAPFNLAVTSIISSYLPLAFLSPEWPLNVRVMANSPNL
ncbi:hypothetical protein lpg0333 [Legionella pneumophila subsp. pneumophila str. Philadelphia 1]|uniref:Secreted protein n=1 Tax=Legionella pneumophila subsp. pneumophila (strain Philadelphia 1 / ATCC 33152 / DSM 7513) TaxID=272624 RepID=Q5ZYN9_LEGPH|nr:hypothetical protein lpg0333 [Legionella pneumophila subsp. pneumophila str. Philadelphia 1]AEW50612.1 hypothetical protein lp12_0334 [Legionella pneumophila subsp. pneumophila ATCC 43290]